MPETLSFQLFPGCCLLCGERSARQCDVCAACENDLPALPCACARCAMPLGATDGDDCCGTCLRRAPPQDALRAAFRYAFPLDRLIQRFKFHGEQSCGRVLGELLASRLSVHAPPACLVPVPLHASRLRERGFNQAEELFRPLARRLRLPLLNGLVTRQRETAVQSGMDAAARRRNVRGAFALLDDRLPAHVAIVDDVVTTGSTVGEIASLLKRAGVERVDVWALARTV